MRAIQRFWTRSRVTPNDIPSVGAESLAEVSRHLRQIQFYFLLVCCGLLLVVYLPRDTTLDKAAEQLNELIRFQGEVGDERIWEVAGTAPPEGEPSREPLAAVVFRLADDEQEMTRVCFLYENEILPGYYGFLRFDGLGDFRQIETHDDFTRLWNGLAREDAFERLTGYAATAYFQQPDGEGLDHSRPVTVQFIRGRERVKSLYEQAFSLHGSQSLSPSRAELVDLEETIEGKQYTRGFRLLRSLGFSGRRALVLPIAVEPARLPVLGRLMDRVSGEFEYLTANDYLLVHGELSDWILDGSLDQLSLHSLRSVLGSVRVSQGEAFPVFGLGIPYQLLFKYGLLVLVIVQLFFWAHVRSFRLLSSARGLSLWAPWLPLYPNRISRILTLVSVVAFPLFVIWQLCATREIRGNSVGAPAVGVLTAGLLLVEFLRLWRLPPAAAQETPVLPAKAA